MAIENFFISTAFRIGDFVKYFSYPFFKMVSIAATKDERTSDLIAGTAAAATYGGLTSHYTGMELENFDRLVRRAYAAEKGVDPKDVKCSDYLDSDNPIIRYRADLGANLMKVRYGASALPLLPSVIDYTLEHLEEPQRSKFLAWRKIKPPENSKAVAHLINGWKVDNHIVYAGFAALYIYEQFMIRKSGIYDASKVQETKHDVARKVEADDLIGIYNRGREDGGKEMVLSKTDRNAIWPILEYMANKMNENEKSGLPFDLSEVIYLAGLDKINPFAKDENGSEVKDASGNRVIDPKAVERAYAEINKVADIGLNGIAVERKKALEEHVLNDNGRSGQPATFSDRINRKLLDTQCAFAERFTPDVLRPSEEISSRDPIR